MICFYQSCAMASLTLGESKNFTFTASQYVKVCQPTAPQRKFEQLTNDRTISIKRGKERPVDWSKFHQPGVILRHRRFWLKNGKNQFIFSRMDERSEKINTTTLVESSLVHDMSCVYVHTTPVGYDTHETSQKLHSRNALLLSALIRQIVLTYVVYRPCK